MKRTISILLALLLLVSTCAAASADEVTELKEIGITLHNSEAIDDCKGVVMYSPYGVIMRMPDVYYMPVIYFTMTEDDLLALESKEETGLTQEDIAFLQNAQTTLCEVLVSDATAEELVAALAPDAGISADSLIPVASADGFNFYYYPTDVEELRDSIGDEWAESFLATQAVFEQLLTQAEFYAPADPEAAMVGQVVSFETTDLDGNTVTSEELFGKNEVTMINYWGTWCHYCVQELGELAEINTRLQEKGCGIIGIVEDGNEAEKLPLAKELMAANGTNYPNILPSDGMSFLDTVTSYPSSFFVDRNGVILCPPISGAAVGQYEEVIDQLLNKEEVSRFTMPAAGANDENVYRVIVKDANGDPVKGVAIQFCDDTSCNLAKTDADGVASFDLPEGFEYIVHVLKVPEGYAKDGGEYHTLTEYSDVVIVLNAA